MNPPDAIDESLIPAAPVPSSLSESEVEELYQRLALANGEAIHAKHWRTRFQASDKECRELRTKLHAAQNRITQLEANLSQNPA